VKKSELRLDWCSHEAAKYAVTHWHYSRTMPVAKSAYIGVWENGLFIGALIFGMGGGAATDGRRFGLAQRWELAELERVALTSHLSAVSRIVSIALKLLRRQSPGLRAVLSYADPAQDHHGGIYQAGGWVYVGTSSKDHAWRDRSGKLWHSRVVGTGTRTQFGRKSAEPVRKQDCVRVDLSGKYCYVMPFDSDASSKIHLLAKPYPKRDRSADSGTEAPTSRGGANPTRSLQLSERID